MEIVSTGDNLPEMSKPVFWYLPYDIDIPNEKYTTYNMYIHNEHVQYLMKCTYLMTCTHLMNMYIHYDLYK